MQGDVIAIVDKDAKTVAEYAYDAWSAVTSAVTDTELTNGVDIATINPFRYRGYYYDEEIGMYYLSNRYYSSYIGRFVNSDFPEIVGLSTIGNYYISKISTLFAINDFKKNIFFKMLNVISSYAKENTTKQKGFYYVI